MALQVFLAASLRKYVKDYNPATGCEITAKAGATVRDVARLVQIPEEEVKLIMVNGVGTAWETPLEGNERVAFFPPVGGG
jgi:molybdopterin synthase sulfur carrier subunit